MVNKIMFDTGLPEFIDERVELLEEDIQEHRASEQP